MGAKAVNGVINIITMDTSETQQGLVKTGAGSAEKGYGSFRYGRTTEQDIYWKVYAQLFERDGFKHSGMDVGGGGADYGRTGLRQTSMILHCKGMPAM